MNSVLSLEEQSLVETAVGIRKLRQDCLSIKVPFATMGNRGSIPLAALHIMRL